MNHDQKSLNECPEKSPKKIINLDSPPPHCADDGQDSLRRPGKRPDLSFNEECSTISGASAVCDPMQTGQIVNDVRKPNRNVIYRYSKALRGCDEAMKDLFSDLVVLDDDGKAHNVPIIWGTQERAVAIILQENVRKDNSLVVDRIKLPALAIHSNDIQFNQNRYTYHMAFDYSRDFTTDGKPGFTTNEQYERDTVFGVARGIPVDISYTLYAWTMYISDMNQLLEQIMLKINPAGYIRIRGVAPIVNVRLDSTGNNIDTEPGDDKLRIIKYQFNMTAESYIPQPIVRKKAVLNTKIDFYDNLNPTESDTVITRIEDDVRESYSD